MTGSRVPLPLANTGDTSVSSNSGRARLTRLQRLTVRPSRKKKVGGSVQKKGKGERFNGRGTPFCRLFVERATRCTAAISSDVVLRRLHLHEGKSVTLLLAVSCLGVERMPTAGYLFPSCCVFVPPAVPHPFLSRQSLCEGRCVWAGWLGSDACSRHFSGSLN